MDNAYYELFAVPKKTDPSNPECKLAVELSLLFAGVSGSCLAVVVEGKRSSGLTAVWLARNRFAVLDKTHQVMILDF